MLRAAKGLAKPVLKKITASVYGQRPLRTWPGFVGRIQDISVPLGVMPNASPLPVGPANINNLLRLIDKTRNVQGDIAECGVYQGATLIPMGIYLTQQGIPKTIHGFDSFEGFAESITKDMAMGGADIEHKHPGGMNETSFELVSGKAEVFRLRNIQLHKGFFEKTLQQCASLKFSFVHLDCDTYDAYMECMEFFYPRVPKGGIISFDEYNDPPWPGCNKAIDEFLTNRPETLEMIAEDNYQKWYVTKTAT